MKIRATVWLISVTCALAQAPTATVIGVVRDPSGLAVPNATAIVHSVDTGIDVRAHSGNDGTFTVPNLNYGAYDVTVEKQGFQTLRQTGIELQVQQVARLDFDLKVGMVTQVVAVQAEVPLINTENGTRGNVVDNSEITELPLAGRSFNELALLSPGIAPGPSGVGGAGMSANGTRVDNMNLLIDGIQTRDIGGGNVLGVSSANLESVQEFKMMTNNYSAEYGSVAGGIITLALKGGTNQLHGSAFEFAQNTIFNARNFFAATRGAVSVHQFGGALEGPVYIPKVYDGRNKTFVMFSIEQDRQTTPQSGLLTVPTALEDAGNFSQTTTASGALVTVKDPLNSNTPFPGEQIPASRISPISQKVMPYWPTANLPGLVNNYNLAFSGWQNTGLISFKVDENLSSNDRLSVKLATMSTHYASLGSTYAPDFPNPKSRVWPVPSASYRHNITPAMIVEGRFGLSRANQYTGVNFPPGSNGLSQGQTMAQKLGIPGTTTDPTVAAFPEFNVTGFAIVGDSTANPSRIVTETYQGSANLTWVKGRHLIKMGGDTTRSHDNYELTNYANGYFPFLGNVTGVALADFDLGMPDSTSLLQNVQEVYMRKNSYFFFAQDDFKLSSRLTLNLGLRYELMLPPTEKYGRWSNFIPGTDHIAIASDGTLPNLAQQLAAVKLTGEVVLGSSLGLPQSLVYADKNDWAPRIGAAWRPFGGNKTVVRAGWGLFYTQDYLAPYITYMGGAYPFNVTQTFSRLTTNPLLLTLANPFPVTQSTFSSSTSISGIQEHMKVGQVQNYNLTIEHQIAKDTAIEVAFSGSMGRRLSRAVNINEPYYYQPQFWGPNNSIPRPYAYWGNITYVEDGSVSNYNAGLFSIHRQMAHGLMLRFNYTYSKALDDASLYQSAPSGDFTGVQDARNPGLEYGRADFDARHVYSFNFIWQLPLHGVVGRGWQLAGTGRGSSGYPITPQTSASNQNLGQAPRPDRTCNGALSDPTIHDWFNLSCFPTVPSGAFRPGTSGRGILDGPGFNTVNLNIARTFKLGERQSLQIRVEAFNVLNHANFNPPTVNVNVAAGGTIASAFGGRSMQLAARYVF